jgi:peptidylprolyl isomerase
MASVTLVTVLVACGAEEEPAPAPAAAPPAVLGKPVDESGMPLPPKKEAPVVAAKPKTYSAPPPMTIDPDKSYTATIVLEKGGNIVIELFAKEAPNTVNNFVFLAQDNYYNQGTFHRVIAGFMAQGGDPTGTGGGSPGYEFDNELSPLRRHDTPGVLSMANKGLSGGRGTNGSQFFITFVPTPALDGYNPDGTAKDCGAPRTSCHTVFGRVIGGMDVVLGITLRDPGSATSPGDVIEGIFINGGQ